MDNNHDIKLVRESLEGAPGAFKALYNAYSGYVYTICTRYGISTIDVKDCMQTIFMEIFKSLSRFDPEKSKFKTWLTSLTINQILAHKRKSSTKYSTLDSEDINLIESTFSVPVESVMDEKIMHEILNRMPAKYSSVFNLFIIDGFSHKEIAEKLDVTVSASRTMLHRGRAWAITELKKTFDDPIHSIIKTRSQTN